MESLTSQVVFPSGSPTIARYGLAPAERHTPHPRVNHAATPSTKREQQPQNVCSGQRQRSLAFQQVLRWFGYFREAVVENCSPDEQRVRRIAVHFYLVDNTLDVCEPKQDDSGILQVGAQLVHKWLMALINLRASNAPRTSVRLVCPVSLPKF